VNKFLKYTIRTFAILLGIIVLLYAIAITYVSFNKKKIIARVTSEIAEKLSGDVTIGNVDISFLTSFPHVSVLFENITVKDSLFQQHHHPFFVCGKLSAQVSIMKMMLKQEPLNGLKIENASMYLFTDTSGYTNQYLFTPKSGAGDPPKDTSSSNILNKITVKNFRFVLDNRKRMKLYDIDVHTASANIKTTDTELLIKVKKNSLIHNLAFNLDKGSFVQEASFDGNFDLVFDKRKRELKFHDMKVKLKGQPFVLRGLFQFAGDRKFHLEINSKQVYYEFGKSLLPAKLQRALSIIKVEKPVDVIAKLDGVLLPGEPLVNVQWQTKDNNIQTPFFNVSDASFTGGYTNELIPGLPRKDPNSRIYLHDFTGVWEGLTVQSENVVIDDLQYPMINCDLKSKFQLTTLNNLLQSNAISLRKGTGNLDLVYSGPLEANSNQNTFINGSINFSDGVVTYLPRNISMDNCYGSIVFNNSDVQVNNLRCNVQDTKLNMNGSAKNLLSLIKSNPGKISLHWHVASPFINLQTFATLLKKRNTVVVNTASKGKLRKVAAQIDDMLNQSDVHLTVKTDKLSFKRFVANNVNASIYMVKNDWNLEDVSLSHANGRIMLSGHLKEKDSRYYSTVIKVQMDNVDVNKVFYAFNDFAQDAILSENIEGKLTTTVDAQMDIDRQLITTPSNVEGIVDFSLKNGALMNFEPMRKLQTVLFKKRNFDEIRFAELKNRFTIKDRDILIKRMEIQSTALTLFVEGVYSLKGNTDISIQVPLSNLKKRGEDYSPENIGSDAKAGPSVFVRGKPGEDGNIKFKLDVFNKIRKHLKSDKAKG
jgi:hypothetical protein